MKTTPFYKTKNFHLHTFQTLHTQSTIYNDFQSKPRPRWPRAATRGLVRGGLLVEAFVRDALQALDDVLDRDRLGIATLGLARRVVERRLEKVAERADRLVSRLLARAHHTAAAHDTTNIGRLYVCELALRTETARDRERDLRSVRNRRRNSRGSRGSGRSLRRSLGSRRRSLRLVFRRGFCRLLIRLALVLVVVEARDCDGLESVVLGRGVPLIDGEDLVGDVVLVVLRALKEDVAPSGLHHTAHRTVAADTEARHRAAGALERTDACSGLHLCILRVVVDVFVIRDPLGARALLAGDRVDLVALRQREPFLGPPTGHDCARRAVAVVLHAIDEDFHFARKVCFCHRNHFRGLF